MVGLAWRARIQRLAVMSGCSIEECEAVLLDIEAIDPEAVARCREAARPRGRGAWWRPHAA